MTDNVAQKKPWFFELTAVMLNWSSLPETLRLN